MQYDLSPIEYLGQTTGLSILVELNSDLCTVSREQHTWYSDKKVRLPHVNEYDIRTRRA